MMPKFGLATTAIAMIRVDGGRLQRKEGKGFFGVAFHSFSLALKFTCPLQVWCVLEYSTTVVGYNAGVFGRRSTRDYFFFPL